MQEEDPNYYAIIPASVRYDKTISDAAKLMYAEITALSNKEGYCWATNEYFADLFGKHPNTISRIVSELGKNEHIELEFLTTPLGTKRHIYPLLKNANRGKRKRLDGYSKTFRGVNENAKQNTIINNKSNTKECSDLKKSPSPALKFLDLFTDSILYLNEKTGRKFEISEQDKKGKTDKFKLVCKVFASGYTLEDVKKVIDAKVGEWLHDSKMVKHLTYSTLFAARNFEKYIEEIKAGETKSDKVAPKNDFIGAIRPQIEEMGYKCQKGTIERIYGELKAKMSSGSTDTEICQKVLLFLGNSESRKYSDLNTILSNFNTILETIKKQKQNGTTK